MSSLLILSIMLLLTTVTIDSSANLSSYAQGNFHNNGQSVNKLSKGQFTQGGYHENRINVRPNGNNYNIAIARINLSGKYYFRQCFNGVRIVSTPRWYRFTLEVKAIASGPYHTFIGYQLTYTVGNKLRAVMMRVKEGRWIMKGQGQIAQSMIIRQTTDEVQAERFVLNFENWFNHFSVHADVFTLYGRNGSRMVLVRARASENH